MSDADLRGQKPLKITWIIPTLDQGGAEKQLATLACHIDRSRFEPVVITLTRGGPYEEVLKQSNVPVYAVGKRGKFDPFAFSRLGKIIADLKPDIVHTWIFAANTYGRFVALRQRVPVVIGGERSVDPWKRGWQFLIDRYLSKRSAGIITNSSGVRDFYASKGIDPRTFKIIPNGIATQPKSTIDRAMAFDRMGLPPNASIIGSVGRLWPQKGYKDLIWAAGMFIVVNPNYHYVILGDGPQLPLLQQFSDTTGNARCVHFLGHRSDAAELIPHFDMLWNGSLYEGQSNSIMEAMRSRVAVIASDIPGNRDLVEHGVSGLLYPVGASDDLLKMTTRLAQEPDFKARLVDQAAAKIEGEFTIPRMVKSHEDYYWAKWAEMTRTPRVERSRG